MGEATAIAATPARLEIEAGAQTEDEKDRLQSLLGDALTRGLRGYVDIALGAVLGAHAPTPVGPAESAAALIGLGKHLREHAALLERQHPGSKLYGFVQGVVSWLPI